MMKCTNENFRNVVCLLRYWPRGDVRGMVAWTNTRKRICGDEESKENRSGRKPDLLFCPAQNVSAEQNASSDTFCTV